jgi:agmatinase
MDPSVMPGTSVPVPGGLSFDEAADLLTGLARRGRVVGINFAEHFPSLDANGITALAIVRLIVNLVGVMHGARS